MAINENEHEEPVVAGETVKPATEDRGIPHVGRKGRANKPLIAFLALVAVLLVLFLVARVVIGHFAGKSHAKATTKEIASSIPSLSSKAFDVANAPPPLPSNTSTVPGTAPPVPGSSGPAKLTPAQQAAADLLARRQRSPLIAVGGGGLGGLSGAEAGTVAAAGDRDATDNSFGSLGKALQATRATGVAATTLENPNLTITQGTFIDCILETAIDSTEPGMTRCELPRDVYSTDGRVLLLPRGSRLVGQYQAGQLRQGQKRIFVVWTRVETPDGVLINLDSPSTDDLGRSGVNGRIDNHFIARFGAALLVSVVNDLANYEVAKQSKGGGTQLNFSSTTEESNNLASIIAQNTINQPPTLYKNQGGHIGVFVARDLYFGNVYGLQATGGAARQSQPVPAVPQRTSPQ